MNNNYKPICLGDTANLSNEEWLEWRKHGPNYKNDKSNPIPYVPFSLGGSDMAVVTNCSPFKPAIRLWGEKHGDLQVEAPNNADQLEMGHLMEPVLAAWFEKKTGAKIINDTNMYQHPKYPWALANMDRRFILPDGRKGILEIKTTNYRSGPDHWANDSYPEYYEKQLRFYMGVDNCELGAFICCWGFNPETDVAIRWVDRDLQKEEELFEAGNEFIKSLENNTPPSFNAGGCDSKNALDAIQAIYKKTISEGEVELPESFLDTLITLQTLIEEKQGIDKEKKELEEKIGNLKGPITQAMGSYQTAFCTDKDGQRVFHITNKTCKTSKKLNEALLVQKYPTIDLDEISVETTPRVTFSIKTKAIIS